MLTNKPQELTDLLLPRLGLDGLFAAVYGAGRKPYTKPDPRIFHDVVAEIAAGGGPAVMIGDSITDLNTARAAGAPCILMSYGFTPVPAARTGRGSGAGRFRGNCPQALRAAETALKLPGRPAGWRLCSPLLHQPRHPLQQRVGHGTA